MAWSIFSQGGGEGAAVTWAKDLLSSLGVPQSNANITFIYDWEKSEGGGGKYNPLNQGPVPGHPELTTTGQQFGGGAADYASWQAGITGATDYLHMSSYSGILSALKTSSYSGARAALIASPWAASHYSGGSAFSSATPPGATALAADSGATTQASTTGISIPGVGGLSISGIVTGAINTVLGMLGIKRGLQDVAERTGLIILGFALVILGIHLLAGGSGGGSNVVVNEPSEPSKEDGTSSKSSKASGDEVKTTSKKTVRSAGAETGASEAVEAAAVA